MGTAANEKSVGADGVTNLPNLNSNFFNTYAGLDEYGTGTKNKGAKFSSKIP